MGINIIIVLRIIFMIWRRYKNRIQIQNFHAKILQIVQFIHDTLQIAAIKLTHAHRCRHFIPVTHLRHMLINICIFTVNNIICLIPIIKTIHKNLVHHGTFCPVRCMKSRNQTEIEIWIDIRNHSLTVANQCLFRRFYPKVITYRMIFQWKWYGINIKILRWLF